MDEQEERHPLARRWMYPNTLKALQTDLINPLDGSTERGLVLHYISGSDDDESPLRHDELVLSEHDALDMWVALMEGIASPTCTCGVVHDPDNMACPADPSDAKFAQGVKPREKT